MVTRKGKSVHIPLAVLVFTIGLVMLMFRSVHFASARFPQGEAYLPFRHGYWFSLCLFSI